MNLSVVIPSLGNRNLIPTLNSINNSSIVVDEIIISLPPNAKVDSINFKKFNNIKLRFSTIKGQVAQRIHGFKTAKNNIIVQLDDDIILEYNCLERLLDFINKNPRCAVSAHFHDLDSGLSIYQNLEKTYYKLFNYLKNGIKTSSNGIITKSGFETYPYFREFSEPFQSEWIPGGCTMHLKKNLILHNYFPYSGKAYSEDLFHSIELKKNGIDLYYHPNAIAKLKVDKTKLSFKDFINNLSNDYTIRKILVKKNQLSIIRMNLAYIIKFLIYFFR